MSKMKMDSPLIKQFEVINMANMKMLPMPFFTYGNTI